jgi:hypothetical protein
VRPDATRRAAGWGPRIAVAGVAIAVAGFALFLSFQGFRALRPNTASDQPDLSAIDGGQSGAPAAAPAAPGSDAVGSSSSDYSGKRMVAGAAASGARYLAVGDEAYSWLGVRTPDPASMTQLGTQVTSSLDSSAAPALLTVWRSSTDADIVFVRSTDTSETYVAFRRVIRTFGGKAYSLWGSGITRYGQWPALPSRFTTPTAADGSPTFVSAGKDDSGLEIYAPQGASADQGFAVAPGTTTGDPAAGDPNWTWWFPKP